MWHIQDDFEARGAFDVYEYEGTPVLVANVGKYPLAVADDGRTLGDTPHIKIAVGGITVNGDTYYTGVSVTALGGWHHGRRRELPVFSDIVYDDSRRDAAADHWIALGESKIPEAIDVLANIDSQYEAANTRIADTRRYDTTLSRPDYERACSELGVDPLSDSDCDSYAVRYGNFSYPEYDPETIVSMHLARRRLEQLDAEAPAQQQPAEPQPIAKIGQLWEPCEQCGKEPVYMPLHLCDRCWPTVK